MPLGDTDSRVTHETRDEELSPVLDRNIARLERREDAEQASRTFGEIVAAKVTAISGSMGFVYFHLAAVTAWTITNVGLAPGIAPFDPTFVILATAASVEAIFLSTFVLISQNRDAAMAERRAELDLHVSLLAERELTTLARVVRSIAVKLDVPVDDLPEVRDAQRTVAPEKILDRLEKD
jgi:uncharacterized membrane protein